MEAGVKERAALALLFCPHPQLPLPAQLRFAKGEFHQALPLLIQTPCPLTLVITSMAVQIQSLLLVPVDQSLFQPQRLRLEYLHITWSVYLTKLHLFVASQYPEQPLQQSLFFHHRLPQLLAQQVPAKTMYLLQ
jgi:hypothetical protein